MRKLGHLQGIGDSSSTVEQGHQAASEVKNRRLSGVKHVQHTLYILALISQGRSREGTMWGDNYLLYFHIVP